MSTYLQAITEYNRYVKEAQIRKEAGTPAYPGYLKEGEDAWTDEQAVAHLYQLTEPNTRAAVDRVVKQEGGISPTRIVMLAGASNESNNRLWSEIGRSGLEEYNGYTAKLFSAPAMAGLRATAAHTIKSMQDKGMLGSAKIGVGAFAENTNMWGLPGAHNMLGSIIRNGIYGTGAHSPSEETVTPSKEPVAPSIGSHAMTGAVIGAPIALGGLLLKRPKLGLLGMGLTTAAGAIYGAARDNGWKGWAPTNTMFDYADTMNPITNKD